MGLVARTAYSAGGTITAAGQNSNENAIVNEINGNLENINVKSSAAIAASKLDLSAIAQSLVMSSAIVKQAKGADVASVAGAITLGDDGNYFDITGTNAITSITAKTAGTVVTLQFDSTASLVDGSNLKLSGNFTGAAEAQITLVSDGTNWFEVSRNAATPITATQAEMETGTSTTVFVSPGRTQYHPGVCKAQASFNGNGTVALISSHNVSSVTDNGTGDYTVNFTTSFSGTFTSVTGGRRNSTTAPFTAIQAQTTSSVQLVCYQGDFTTKNDNELVTVACFGDQ